MKFISSVLFFGLLFTSCNHRKEHESETVLYPPYQLIQTVSNELKNENGFVLSCYGFNKYDPQSDVKFFHVSYRLSGKRDDLVSIEQARALLVTVVEKLLTRINADPEVLPYLSVYPYTENMLKITLYFEDENRIELGRGISRLYFYRGQIEYERYEIEQYCEVYPAIGKHFVQHTESYEEALELVRGKTGEAI